MEVQKIIRKAVILFQVLKTCNFIVNHATLSDSFNCMSNMYNVQYLCDFANSENHAAVKTTELVYCRLFP